MINFQNKVTPVLHLKGWLVGGLIVGFVAMLSLNVSHAQSSRPLRLAPVAKKADPPDLNSPAPRTPRSDIANPRLPTLSSRITGGAVQVDTLKALNADEAGTLTPLTGALGTQMWQGTSANLIGKLLRHLPTHAPSAAMRTLMLKLLLSPARVPDGAKDQNHLIGTRLSALMTMGALDEANQLFEALPTARASDLAVLEADLRFLSNDNARACAMAEQEMANQSTAYWQKAFTFCQIINGEKEKAGLSLSLMRELGETDEAFLTMAEGIISETPQALTSLGEATPLNLAMARVGQIELPGDVMESHTPSVLRAIALSPKTSIGLRLDAAERADAAGALPVDTLRQLYTSVEFSKDDLASPLSRAEVEFGPMIRALLYRTSLVQTVPTAQAEATARAFALARDEGRYGSTVNVFQPVLRRIPPSNQLLWFAPEAVRALLLVGDLERAQAWYQVLQAGSIVNDDAAKAIDRFRPLAHLFEFDVNENIDRPMTETWWKAVGDQPDAGSKGILLFTILAAMGVDVPDRAWQPLISWQPRVQQTLPNAALINRLRHLSALNKRPVASPPDATDDVPQRVALQNMGDALLAERLPQPIVTTDETSLGEPARDYQRVAEIVLLSLLALGDAGPAKTEVGSLSVILQALLSIRLTSDAQALALEAVLANDL